MRWVWLLVSVISGTIGDTLSAQGMAEGGEVEEFDTRGMLRVLRYISTHKIVLLGVAANAISFLSFIALLSEAPLSFSVPASASSYIFKTALAEWYLHEHVGWQRWTGALLVACGVYLLTL